MYKILYWFLHRKIVYNFVEKCLEKRGKSIIDNQTLEHMIKTVSEFQRDKRESKNHSQNKPKTLKR